LATNDLFVQRRTLGIPELLHLFTDSTIVAVIDPSMVQKSTAIAFFVFGWIAFAMESVAFGRRITCQSITLWNEPSQFTLLKWTTDDEPGDDHHRLGNNTLVKV
jgi:hypothetical protein